MKLEGSLDAFSLPDVFALLSMTKKTGGLHLRRGDVHGVVHLAEGALTGGTSDTSRQGLARRLVGGGHVTEEALRAAVEATRDDPTTGVVRALQQAGAVDPAVLRDVVTEQLQDAVFELVRWSDGEFSFALDEPYLDEVGVTLPVDEVVTEARRRLETWASVASAVPSPDTVLTLALAPADDPVLSRAEWALLALVDGRRTVAELVALTGRGEYAVVSVLAALVERGLLRADESDGVSALLARQSLLAELEGRADAEPVRRPAAPTAPADPDPDPEPDLEPAAELVEAAHVVAEAAERRVPAQPVRAQARTPVTPTRSEPALPRRRPDHPDDVPASVIGQVDGATVMAPSPSYIERDPNVNKSLLLRLIAGVRGL